MQQTGANSLSGKFLVTGGAVLAGCLRSPWDLDQSMDRAEESAATVCFCLRPSLAALEPWAALSHSWWKQSPVYSLTTVISESQTWQATLCYTTGCPGYNLFFGSLLGRHSGSTWLQYSKYTRPDGSGLENSTKINNKITRRDPVVMTSVAVSSGEPVGKRDVPCWYFAESSSTFMGEETSMWYFNNTDLASLSFQFQFLKYW